MRFLEKLSGKVSTIQITGGEAMLHPHFFDVLRYCKENFKRVCVSTTGALIDKNNIKDFIGTHVYLSLYSFNQAENTRYSGGNVYSKIMSAIKMLVDNNVHVCINTIVNERNKNEFEGFVNQAVALGVQGIGAGKVTRVGRGKNMNEEEYCRKESEQQIAAIERNFDVEGVYLSTFVENGEDEKLQCGFHKWFISENGRVLPCTFFPEDIFYIGTLESDVRDIFNVNKFEEMKEKLKAWGKELNMEGIKMCEVCGALRELEND